MATFVYVTPLAVKICLKIFLNRVIVQTIILLSTDKDDCLNTYSAVLETSEAQIFGEDFNSWWRHINMYSCVCVKQYVYFKSYFFYLKTHFVKKQHLAHLLCCSEMNRM